MAVKDRHAFQKLAGEAMHELHRLFLELNPSAEQIAKADKLVHISTQARAADWQAVSTIREIASKIFWVDTEIEQREAEIVKTMKEYKAP